MLLLEGSIHLQQKMTARIEMVQPFDAARLIL
jgi:hypothetical protein